MNSEEKVMLAQKIKDRADEIKHRAEASKDRFPLESLTETARSVGLMEAANMVLGES